MLLEGPVEDHTLCFSVLKKKQIEDFWHKKEKKGREAE